MSHNRLVHRWFQRRAALVGTDTAAIYAIAPEMLAKVIADGDWADKWGTDPGSDAADKVIRQHGGAVFHTGGDGVYDVKIPTKEGEMPIVRENGYMAPYGTSAARVASRWIDRQAKRTAEQAYEEHVKEIERLHKMLDRKLKIHAEHFKKNPGHWGYVGDIEHIEELVRRAAESLWY